MELLGEIRISEVPGVIATKWFELLCLNCSGIALVIDKCFLLSSSIVLELVLFLRKVSLLSPLGTKISYFRLLFKESLGNRHFLGEPNRICFFISFRFSEGDL